MKWVRNDRGEYEAVGADVVIVPSAPATTGYPKGWVLVVEGRQVDHYHYLSDAKEAAKG